MPIPVYVVCSRSASLDANTREVSIFHLIDAFQVTKIEPGGAIGELVPIRVSAAWMLEPGKDSPEDKFDYRLFVKVPGHDPLVNIAEGSFSFSKPIHRVTTEGKFAGFPGLGVMRIVSQIRKQGNENWIDHVFPVLITESRDGE